jgi:thioredoxin-like negative regulator of GroEL
MENISGQTELEDFIWNNKDDKVVVIYFGATWCGPCEKLKTKLISNDAKQIMPDLAIGHIELDSNSELAELYNVQSIPTQIFIKLNDNNIVEFQRIIGYDWIKFNMTYQEYKKNC